MKRTHDFHTCNALTHRLDLESTRQVIDALSYRIIGFRRRNDAHDSSTFVPKNNRECALQPEIPRI